MKEHRARVNARLWEFAHMIDYLDYEISNRQIFIRQAYNPLRSAAGDGQPRGNQVGDSTAAAAILIGRYQSEILELVREKERTLAAFECYISGLKDSQKQVLRLRYIKRTSLQKIAWKLNYSVASIKRILGEAQDKLQSKVNTF